MGIFQSHWIDKKCECECHEVYNYENDTRENNLKHVVINKNYKEFDEEVENYVNKFHKNLDEVHKFMLKNSIQRIRNS